MGRTDFTLRETTSCKTGQTMHLSHSSIHLSHSSIHLNHHALWSVFLKLACLRFFFQSSLYSILAKRKKANPPTTNQPEKGKGNTCAQQWRVEIVIQKEWTLNNEIAQGTQIQRYVWTCNQHKFLL